MEDAARFISLERIDLGIIVTYFALTVVAGLLLSRLASRGISEYFLGGHKIPWWVMGASGTASNLDMTGTMLIVSFFFARGLQGFWVALRGGAALPLGILLAFMGRWLHRSKVMTTAEWMHLRFGTGRGGDAARLLSAVSNLVVTVGATIYFCKGTGKFLSIFLPLSPTACAILMVSIGLVYTMSSGLYGVVYTDLIQEALLIVTALIVFWIAFTLPDLSEVIASAGPSWTALGPRWTADPMPWLSNPEVYRLFGLSIVFWIARGVLEGAGGFTGGYMPQRYYATASERQAGLLTAEWIALLSLRWLMVMALAVLGLHVARTVPELGRLLASDPEKTLPVVLGTMLPAGPKGIAVAGLVAAAMSTFDSTINAGAAYWVKDIYQQFINPEANDRRLVRQGYLATALIAVASVAVALTIHNINEIWGWITGPLSAGLFTPIVLRWWWWRLNGEGFAIGTAAGLLAAIAIKIVAPESPLYITFPATAAVSLLGSLAGSYATAPTPSEVVRAFYQQLRPFGIWGPVRRDLGLRHPVVQRALSEGRNALFTTPVAMLWHLSLFVAVMHIVLRDWSRVLALGSVTLVTAALLYRRWYLELPPEPPNETAEETEVAEPSSECER